MRPFKIVDSCIEEESINDSIRSHYNMRPLTISHEDILDLAAGITEQNNFRGQSSKSRTYTPDVKRKVIKSLAPMAVDRLLADGDEFIHAFSDDDHVVSVHKTSNSNELIYLGSGSISHIDIVLVHKSGRIQQAMLLIMADAYPDFDEDIEEWPDWNVYYAPARPAPCGSIAPFDGWNLQ